MKVLWLITMDEYAQAQFELALATTRTGCDYLVRRAESLSQIPEAHLAHSGVVFVLDAFNPSHPGFEGLKKLRSMGFGGHVFVAGEPSPETAEEAFSKFHLSGFFGTLDRVDYALAAGVIHNCFSYKTDLDLRVFLEDGGRSSEEEIANAQEFAHFVNVLGKFVSRFGLSPQLVKKVLMGLSLGYMKMGSGGPAFEGKFAVQFGIDKRKLILSLRALSKGNGPDGILREFTQAVLSLGSTQSLKPGLFPDMNHVVRSAQALQVFSGNFEQENSQVDPLTLMTVVPFPDSVAQNEISAQWFGYCHVKKSEEMPIEIAQAPLVEALETESTQTSLTDSGASPQPIDESAVKELLSENMVLASPSEFDIPSGPGDAESFGIKFEEEVQREPSVAEGENVEDSDSALAPSEPAMDSEEIAKLKSELEELRAVSAAMAVDVKRLMKERREPHTDKELREAKRLLEERVKELNAEKRQLEEALASKNSENSADKMKPAA